MSWGPHYEFLKKVEESKGILPKALEKRPALFEDLVPVWKAFLTLNRTRPVYYGGPGAILVSEIAAYLDLIRVEDQDRRVEILELITSLDNAWLARREGRSAGYSDRDRQSRGKAGKPGSQAGPRRRS